MKTINLVEFFFLYAKIYLKVVFYGFFLVFGKQTYRFLYNWNLLDICFLGYKETEEIYTNGLDFFGDFFFTAELKKLPSKQKNEMVVGGYGFWRIC